MGKGKGGENTLMFIVWLGKGQGRGKYSPVHHLVGKKGKNKLVGSRFCHPDR